MTIWLILLLVWTAGIPTAFLALASFAAWRRREAPTLPVRVCLAATRRYVSCERTVPTRTFEQEFGDRHTCTPG